MTAKRRFGSVRKLPSGRWQARYLGPDDVSRTAPKTFATRKDADLWLTQVETDIHRGTWVDPAAGRITVADWSKRWLDAVEVHLKVKTYATYRSLVSTKINPYLGDLPLSAVKPITVKEWISDLTKAGFSPSRVRQSYRVLAQIMRSAVENDLIPISPCRGIKLPRMPQTEPHILSEAEMDGLISATKEPHDLLVMFLAYAGMRIGEAFALRRSSLDLKSGSVTISESLVEIEGKLSFDTPKSHQKRTVYLPDFVVKRAREVLRTISKDEDALLFPTGSGAPQHYNAWRTTWFDPAVKAAGLREVTPHDLRASHASAVTAKHGVMAAAARLGHAHASVTTRHYARSTSDADARVAREIASAREDRADLARIWHDEEGEDPPRAIEAPDSGQYESPST